MPGMRITLDAAMRARDVSRPRDPAADTAVADTGSADTAGSTAAGAKARSEGEAAGGAAPAGETRREPAAGQAAPRHRGDRYLDGLSSMPSRPGKRRGKGNKRRRRR